MKQYPKWVPALALLLLMAFAPNTFAQEPEPTATPGPGGSDCSHASPPNYCELFEEGEIQSGSYTAPYAITRVVIGAAGEEIEILPEDSPYNDGCYRVEYSTSEGGTPNDTVEWERVGTGNQCHEISHVEIWWYVTPTAINLKDISVKSSSPLINVAGIAIIIGLLLTPTLVWWHFRGRKWWARVRDRA